jgi:hypothetical protein
MEWQYSSIRRKMDGFPAEEESLRAVYVLGDFFV